MAEKLEGKLNLSRIPKELIQTAPNGEKYCWIDVVELRTVGKYGDTHAITIYDKSKREAIFIANLRKKTFGAPQSSTQNNSYRQPSAPSAAPVASAPLDEDNGLPF